MEKNPEAGAMVKLLRKFVPYEGDRRPLEALSMRETAEEVKDPERRAELLARADKMAVDRIVAELWKLDPLDAWEIEAWLQQAIKRVPDMDTDIRKRSIGTLQARLYALYALRRPDTQGKVRLLTADEGWDLDPSVAEDVYSAYITAFKLTEAERPKVEAPPSTDV